MKLTCADCGFESDEAIVRDGLGWKGICPKCGQSFDAAIPRGLVVMMFADDSNPEKDAENFVDDFLLRLQQRGRLCSGVAQDGGKPRRNVVLRALQGQADYVRCLR